MRTRILSIEKIVKKAQKKEMAQTRKEKDLIVKMRKTRCIDNTDFDTGLESILGSIVNVFKESYRGGNLNGVCCIRLLGISTVKKFPPKIIFALTVDGCFIVFTFHSHKLTEESEFLAPVSPISDINPGNCSPLNIMSDNQVFPHITDRVRLQFVAKNGTNCWYHNHRSAKKILSYLTSCDCSTE